MQRLEVSGAVRHIYMTLGGKVLIIINWKQTVCPVGPVVQKLCCLNARVL
jgi:hypothetical protein